MKCHFQFIEKLEFIVFNDLPKQVLPSTRYNHVFVSMFKSCFQNVLQFFSGVCHAVTPFTSLPSSP